MIQLRLRLFVVHLQFSMDDYSLHLSYAWWLFNENITPVCPEAAVNVCSVEVGKVL